MPEDGTLETWASEDAQTKTTISVRDNGADRGRWPDCLPLKARGIGLGMGTH